MVDARADRRRLGIVLRHRTEESALRVGGLHVGDALLAAHIEGGVGHVRAGRDRALDDVKGGLDLRVHRRIGERELGRFAIRRNLEEGEHVGVVDHRSVGAGEAVAEVVLAGFLVGGLELALGPVAHHLKQRVALDHHRGGEVPVAAGVVRIGVGLQLGQVVEGLLHRVRLQSALVEIDEGFLVEVRAAGRHDDRIEHRRLLPWLASERERDDAGLLGLVEQREELVEVLRIGSADLVHDRLVDPDPVDRVDVDRNRVPLAVGGSELLQCGRNDLGPAFLVGERGDVGELARFRVVEREITEDLRGGRRVAGGHHRLQRGHRGFAATAGDGHVLPGVAFFRQVLLDDVQRGCFAA